MLLDPRPIDSVLALKARRAALISDSPSLSPDEVWDVQRRPSGVSVVTRKESGSEQPWIQRSFQSNPLPDYSDEDQALWPPSWQFSTSKGLQKGSDNFNDGPAPEEGYAAKPTSCVPKRDKLRKAASRSRRISLEPALLHLENKRSHITYSEDERRSYETGILEDIPHMSEIGFENIYQSIDVKQSLDSIRTWGSLPRS